MRPRDRPTKCNFWQLLPWSFFTAAILIAPCVRAESTETDPFELSPEQLFGATITSASRTSEKLWDAPAAGYVLTNEDITRAGATSVHEALRLVPGVQVARINAGGWAVSVRGFNGALSNKLLVLIDGREVYDPLFSGVYWDIQDTVMEDIDRIEVIRGPGASLWGANAMNGVVNIITKKAEDTQGNLLSVTSGNQEHAIVSERYGGSFGEQGYYRVYGKYLDRAHSSTLSGGDAQDEQRASRVGFRADWRANENDRFTMQGNLYQSDAGQLRMIPIISAAPPFSSLEEEDISAHGGNVLGRWNRTLHDGAKMTGQAHIDFTSREQSLLEDNRVDVDLDAQLELPKSGIHSILYGGRYRYTHDELTETSNILTFDDGTNNNQLFSAFLQDKLTLVPEEWYLTLGSKIEHNDYTGIELQPNARLQWHPNETQMVWASVSRAVRTPNRLEHDIEAVQSTAANISLDTLPNPNFDSEVLIAYELGYRNQLTPDLQLDMATFYNDYDKLATYTFQGVSAGTNPPHAVIGFAPTNQTQGESYGVETTLDWRARPNWRLSTTYSLMELRLQGPNLPANQTLAPEAAEGLVPQQQFNLRSEWDVSKALTLDSVLYYVDSLPGNQVPAYWRFDTRLGWKAAEGLEFNLVGQNLFDDRHREFDNPTDVFATEVERSIFGQVVWRY